MIHLLTIPRNPTDQGEMQELLHVHEIYVAYRVDVFISAEPIFPVRHLVESAGAEK